MGVVGLADLLARIDQEREWELILLLELGVACTRLAIDAENQRLFLQKMFPTVAHGAELLRSTRRGVGRIKYQHDIIPAS